MVYGVWNVLLMITGLRNPTVLNCGERHYVEESIYLLYNLNLNVRLKEVFCRNDRIAKRWRGNVVVKWARLRAKNFLQKGNI